jgi:hypothetical protein
LTEVVISLMCHPDRVPKIEVPSGHGYEAFVNRTPNYAEAYRVAIARAVQGEMDLVTADTDGFHPVAEIVKLATGNFYEGGSALVLPYRENIGFQSNSFSYFFSLVERRRVRDATAGLCRLSLGFMRSLPSLKAPDMTIHIEILKHALKSGAQLVQYGYSSATNDPAESRRTPLYQLRLLKAALN